jgi:hypothetical protein
MVSLLGPALILGLLLAGVATAQNPAAKDAVTPSGKKQEIIEKGLEQSSQTGERTYEREQKQEEVVEGEDVAEGDHIGLEEYEKTRLRHAIESQKSKVENGTAKPVEWESQEQKTHCEAVLGKLKENFLSARYHSIQGDSCATARYARTFMDLVDTCRQDCPKDLLAERGYNERIIRNLRWLYELGSKRCLEE